MKKIMMVINIGMMFLTSSAQAGVYILQDDVMNHRFWVNTDNVYRYSNQLLLPATVTDINNEIITTDAMVTYDTRYGNINMMHYGNYCIFNRAFQGGGRAVIAQTGTDYGDVNWLEDYIYQIYNPAAGSENKPALSADKEMPKYPVGGTASGKDDSVTNTAKAGVPSANPSTYLWNREYNHWYALYDYYRIGDPNFIFFVYTMVVQTASGPADGLLFVQQVMVDVGELRNVFLVIITVFESQWLRAYSMAGILDPQSNLNSRHRFALIAQDDGGNSVTDFVTVWVSAQ